MARALGQNILIESRPGANTVIGTELLVRAPANGYSALVIAPSFTVNPFVHSKLPYDTPRDFSGVTRMVYNPLIICAHPTLPAKNIQELVQLAKKRPGELTWGVSSIIGGGRIAGELFAEAAKIRMINVPFGGGGPAVTAVLGGHTSLIVGNVLECAHHAQSGRLRALAVTSPQRASMLPQVPTVAESGWSGFEALKKGTHFYKGEWSPLDQLIVSYGMLFNRFVDVNSFEVVSHEFLFYTGKDGVKSPARVYVGDSYKGGYSDHLPILLHVN
jgi:tripartite-type tricarboxylate transporter receptor subunit TctC